MKKVKPRKKDPGLEALLDLNGSQYHFQSGYWTKIRVHKVKASGNRPL